ncbi:response regulator transcription factor [Sulfuricurvum sp.]|uniref:response regulator transcription factor n=1 Tax=Sulfuricurvum sp. TaxID=2025608 RepID=UPI00262C199C|nr:response regulator transcription factor [Sulfuricurvum sp.]MDD2781815.1 response regulator transcription factor [Sulfuricurvum sp.]
MLSEETYCNLKNYTVLIAEDDQVALNSLFNTLKRYFKNVITATDGYEAYRKSLENSIDLIVSDMRMPYQDGADFIKKIRESHPDLPVIFMSAYQDSQTLLKVIPLNITEYLIKPIQISKILELSLKVVQQKRQIVTAQNSKKNLVELINGVIVDIDNKTLKKENTIILLTKKEFELLSFLIHNRQSILSKLEIEYALWNGELVAESSVKTLLKKLRDKIGNESVITVKNLGYKINLHHQFL